MPTKTFALTAALFAVLIPVHRAAAGECARINGHQYFNVVDICVSSALPASGANRHDADALIDNLSKTASCEGAIGPGLDSSITINIKNPEGFQQIFIENGYLKSPASFYDNARIKRARISGDFGAAFATDLADGSDAQTITLPDRARAHAAKIEIVEVYPGRKFADTCVTNVGIGSLEGEDASE